MGTTGFWSFYNDLIQKVSLDNLKGKILFIDIVLYIHKYVIGIRKSGYDMKSKDGKIINHIYAITKIIKNFSELGIFPIPVFDGKSPAIKEESIEKRKEYTEMSIEKCNEIIMDKIDNLDEINIHDINIDNFADIITDEVYIKYFKRSFILTQQMINECKELLDKSGIPYINSIGEADPQCVGMQHYYKNISSGIYSEDSDILLYGADSLYRNIDFKNNEISILTLNSIIDYLQKKSDIICKKYNIPQKKITRNILIDFSIIMGNDYCNGIRISGGNNRDKLFEFFVISNFDMNNFVDLLYSFNIDKIIFYIPDVFLIKWKLSRDLYLNVDIIDPKIVDIKYKKYNISDIKKYLEKFNIRHDIIERYIATIEKNFNKYNQSIKYYNNSVKHQHIDDWIKVSKKN
jgi:flap endonuclease-1